MKKREMIYHRPISILVLIIIIFSIIATSYAIFSSQGPGTYEYKSIFGETINIYGKGLYQHDSAAMAIQAIAQDIVTLIVGVPLLFISIFLAWKGLFRGKLLLSGTLGYFLYTYASYSFLSMYNSMFLIYVMIMSASFFAFILSLMSFDILTVPLYFHDKLPVKFIGSILIAIACMFGFMWVGKIVPPLFSQTPPKGIDQYTTLVIQALDLGLVVPTGILAGVLLIKRKPFGYLLASIITIKELTLLTALSAMIILQRYNGIEVSPVELELILLLNIIIIYIMFLILKNVKEVSGTNRGQMSV
ncbi:hypothetical protein [Neobacillus sp. PS2-9]|uniref:hypothetical protein n=1 Tax=Neobacillus sp. PS2-9 TaxID=3070676 RepID=UPI0027E1CDFA|nr:hypothetical protein [Neobacillus sp. PS2-9]WML57604.1 hypothetical protein RCG25_22305 [Neobacillus sp. PS2-9]